MFVIQACKQLNKGVNDFHDAEQIAYMVNQLRPHWDPPISLEEILDICDTEGNSQNGGGSFTVNGSGKSKYIKFEPSANVTTSPITARRTSSHIGEIGNPIPGPNPLGAAPGSLGGFGSPPFASTSTFPRQFSSPQSGF